MHLKSSLLFLFGVGAFAQDDANTTHVPQSGTCTNPRVRKSWHTLSNPEKTEYLRAVKCLWSRPARGTNYFAASKNRHDDYATLHINQTTAPAAVRTPANRGLTGPGIHFNGVFLPWHRYLLWAYENTLIEECGYKGAQPYWDWTLDNPEHGSHFNASPVFDAVYGFGGNGKDGSVPIPIQNTTANTTVPDGPPPGSCINTGPFAGLEHNTGVGFNLQTSNPHCLVRNIQSDLADDTLGWKADVTPVLALTEYFNMSIAMSVPTTGKSRGIHGGGHSGVNGEMQNVWSSINDPLFFMHHAMIDYVWWVWQKKNPQNLYAIGGPIYPNGTGVTTLDYPVYMSPFIAKDVPIRNVMDTLNTDGKGILCYSYVDNGQPVPP